MVPLPSGLHQRLGGELFAVLLPLAKARGLVGAYEAGLYRPGADLDYRVPDHLYAHAELATERGVDGPAEVVVELASPGDETYDKLDFYADLGVGEVIVVHPEERTVELFVLARRTTRPRPSRRRRSGALRCPGRRLRHRRRSPARHQLGRRSGRDLKAHASHRGRSTP